MTITSIPFPITEPDHHLWDQARQLHANQLDPEAREFPDHDDDWHWRLYLILDTQNVVGYGSIDTLPSEPTGLYIRWMLIHPDHRNHGLGSRLLHTIAADAEDAGYTLLSLRPLQGEPSTRLTRYYKRHGFKWAKVSGLRYLQATPTDILTT